MKKRLGSKSDPSRPSGKEIWQIVALRLPGEGGRPSLVKVPIPVEPEDYLKGDSFRSLIPYLSTYWGVNDREKCLFPFDAKSKDMKTANGLNYIYWIRDSDPHPKTL